VIVALAIPAGGVPVAAAPPNGLGVALDLAVVSRVTPPWNSDVGYGAVAALVEGVFLPALLAIVGRRPAAGRPRRRRGTGV
jgi:predicted phosphoribosyltransferase